MPDTSPAGNGADVLLEQLERQGVDCIFASPIAVMAPIWEALARRGDARGPRYFRCRHELLAMGLASGYYKATGRSQVVFLPSSLGVQNGSMGLHTALQERIPVTVLSPDTLSYGEDPAADPGPEWPSLLVDLVGPARNAEAVTKWAHRARTGAEMVNELRRASFIAQSVPLGPTLLEIPFDLLMGPGPVDVPDWVSPVPVVAARPQIDQAAQILAHAENPVIVTEHGGRTDAQRAALVSIAESLSAPVFEFMMPAYHNFPRSHPLYGAGPVEDVLAAADAILLAGCNGPWHPPRQPLRPGCAVIHLDEDPLRPRAAYWGYPTTHAIPGSLEPNLEALADALPEDDVFAPSAQRGLSDDARARLELRPQLRPQLEIQGRQQVKRNDARVPKIKFEQIPLDDANSLTDARTLDVRLRFLDPLRVDVDADAAGAEPPRGRNDHSAVTAAEIVEHVARTDARGVEHHVNNFLRRRDVDDIGPALGPRGAGNRRRGNPGNRGEKRTALHEHSPGDRPRINARGPFCVDRTGLAKSRDSSIFNRPRV